MLDLHYSKKILVHPIRPFLLSTHECYSASHYKVSLALKSPIITNGSDNLCQKSISVCSSIESLDSTGTVVEKTEKDDVDFHLAGALAILSSCLLNLLAANL